MVLKPQIIRENLKELDSILEELSKYKDKTCNDLKASLSLRWIIERGLLAASNIVFNIANHILAGQFGIYPDTYEDSLEFLAHKGVISSPLYQKLKGLGGFRNILAHEYLHIDLDLLHKNFLKAFEIFPAFSLEIQHWLEGVNL